MGKLTGKVALVTGAGRGLGRAYALRLASLGADIVVADLRLDSALEFDEELGAASVMAECEQMGVRSLGIEADVTQRANVEQMFAQTLDTFGRVDILVNNAGGMLRDEKQSYASNVSEDDWRFIMDVNLTQTVSCCQCAAVPMRAQGGGKIINVSSQAGLQGNPLGWYAHYSVAKAGIARIHAPARGGTRTRQHQRQRHRAGPDPDQPRQQAVQPQQRGEQGQSRAQNPPAPHGRAGRLRPRRGVPRHRPFRLRDGPGDLH